jgi:hypothetical protein
MVADRSLIVPRSLLYFTRGMKPGTPLGPDSLWAVIVVPQLRRHEHVVTRNCACRERVVQRFTHCLFIAIAFAQSACRTRLRELRRTRDEGEFSTG